MTNLLTQANQHVLDEIRDAFPAAFEQAVDDYGFMLGEENTKQLRSLIEAYALRRTEIELIRTNLVDYFERHAGIEEAMRYRHDSDAFSNAICGTHESLEMCRFANLFTAPDDVQEQVLDEFRSGRVRVVSDERPNPEGFAWPVVNRMDAWLEERL
jgi:hypothetical protein